MLPHGDAIPALRVPPAETQVDGLPPALSLDSDLDTPFAQRRCLRAEVKLYERLVRFLYDRYDQQLSKAVPRSSFYGILGVESMESLNF